MNELISVSIKNFAASCDGGSFLGFPTWYKYIHKSTEGGVCTVRLDSINDIWLIVIAVIEILLRIAVLVAVAFILIGGFKYITSRANPDKTSTAKNTVLDALIGLVIAVVATAVVSFIAGSFN